MEIPLRMEIAGLAIVLLLFQFFKAFLLFFRQRLLVLAPLLGFLLKVIEFLVLFIRQSLGC